MRTLYETYDTVAKINQSNNENTEDAMIQNSRNGCLPLEFGREKIETSTKVHPNSSRTVSLDMSLSLEQNPPSPMWGHQAVGYGQLDGCPVCPPL